MQEESRVSLNAVDSLDALLSDVNKGRGSEGVACGSFLLTVELLSLLRCWQQVTGIRYCLQSANGRSELDDRDRPLALRQAVSYLSLPPNVLQDLYSQAGTRSRGE